MKHIPVRLGPLALLLTVITICLSVLAMLACANSAADMRLSERYADAVKTRYLLEQDGQEFLQEVAGRQPQAGEILQESFQRDGYTLTVELTAEGDRYKVSEWKISKDWQPDTTIDDLWQGE